MSSPIFWLKDAPIITISSSLPAQRGNLMTGNQLSGDCFVTLSLAMTDLTTLVGPLQTVV